MRNTTYRYNTLTCQYERVKTRASSVVWYCLAITLVAACMLLGILLLHDRLVNTENETRLRNENRALREHHAILSSELNELQPLLTSLQNKDHMLHAKFFGAPPEVLPVKTEKAVKEKLLLANASSFRGHISALKKVSDTLILRSERSNAYFGTKVLINEDLLANINALPTLQPVSPWSTDRLISGYGPRINPFHKGLYDHVGLDIAMPRGTPVVATGSGKIVQVKRSDLQAGYGNYVDIDHGLGLVTRYAHLEDIHVKLGMHVDKGQTIGTVGSSGGSVAPHIHYEILRDGKNTDPVNFMVQGLTSDEHDQLTAISHRQNQSLD